MQLEDGYLIVLPRDEAKAFFGNREDEARLNFIEELLAKENVQRLSLQGKWQTCHDSLAAIDIPDSMLGQCLLGGRPMYGGNEYHIFLVRPDIVGFIAQQGNSIDVSGVSSDVQQDIRSIVQLYATAAELGGAMVFVAAAN